MDGPRDLKMQAQINHHQPPLGASTNHQQQYQIQIGKKENKRPSLTLPPTGHHQHRNPPPTPYLVAKLKTNPSKTIPIPSHHNKPLITQYHTQPPNQNKTQPPKPKTKPTYQTQNQTHYQQPTYPYLRDVA